MRLNVINIKSFLAGYIDSALWSTGDIYEDTKEYYELDSEFSSVSNNCKVAMLNDCSDFIKTNLNSLLKFKSLAECDDYRLGFLFWLNRNGHGSGFWDELTSNDDIGNILSDACKPYGNFDLYGDFEQGTVRSHHYG